MSWSSRTSMTAWSVVMSPPTNVTALDLDRFIKWLKDSGAEIIPQAPEFMGNYTVLKYRFAGAISIIYRNDRGRLRWDNQAADHYLAFKQGKQMSVLQNGGSKIKNGKKPQLREAILSRDGNRCWLCNDPMKFGECDPQDPHFATIEHLWSRSRGGPNLIDNLVLCHFECNQVLDERPMIEKIKIRDWVRAYTWTYVSTSGVKNQPAISALKERLQDAPDGII